MKPEPTIRLTPGKRVLFLTKDPELIGFPLFKVTDYASVGSAAAQPVQPELHCGRTSW